MRERELVAAFWRLAEQGERNGIRILEEPISGEHFATSGRDPRKLYRLTHWSCSCQGFMRHQRCQHYALFLAELGSLPDLDPEPAAPAPLGARNERSGACCPICEARGEVIRQRPDGTWIEVPCPDCHGDRADVSSADGTEPTVAAAAETGDAGIVPVDGGRPAASALPDPWATHAAPAGAIPTPAPQSSETVPVPIPFSRREDRARALTQTVEEAIASLAEQLAAGHTEEYLAVLAFYSRFHRYSIANTLLIRRQRPDASLVAGLKRWNQLGYRVRAGERAIWIWAPIVKRDIDAVTGEESERVVGFRPAAVFADCQLANLEEKPLPSLFQPLPDDCRGLYQAARERVIASGIAVDEVPLPGGIQGASTGGRILIKSGLDSRSKLLVLAHEVAHELAHHGAAAEDKPLPVRELEAESTAFVVGQVLGVASPFSADYLLGHGLDAPALQTALTSIQTLVRKVLDVIRPEQAEEDAVPLAA